MIILIGGGYNVKVIVDVDIWILRYKKLILRWSSLPLVGLGGDKMMTPEWYNYRDLGCYVLVVSK